MSLSKEMTELGIPLTSLNLLRNDLMKFYCGPLVYQTIINWGFAKPEGRKIIDHMNDLDIGKKINDKKFTKFIKDNKLKLDKDSFIDFDITALHDFLPILCYDKIAQTGGQEYDDRIKDPNSVESFLKKIKAFRNDVSHESAKAMEDNIDQMKITMRECISAAGKLYGKDQTKIDEKLKDLNAEFNKVLLDTTHYYDNRLKCIANIIRKHVPAMLLERYSPRFTIYLPGNSTRIDSSDIFQCSNLSVTTGEKSGTKDKNKKNVFNCTKLFKNNNSQFIVILGGPGSGKTTLAKHICQYILQTSVHGGTPRYVNSDQFKILIYLECRFETETNLAKFLKESLKNFDSPEDDIFDAFKMVNGLVFLIDGYDEINNSCRQLVNNIIVFCKNNNATCIVTSRVDAGNNFVRELQDRSLDYTEMHIEPISEMSDKVNFLKIYAYKIDSCIDSEKLVEGFENLTEAAREVFSSPILLALFISLFVNDPASVSRMKNELSAYEAVRTSSLLEISRKLTHASDPIGKAEKIVNKLSYFILRAFREKKYFLERKHYSKLVEDCERIERLPADVKIDILLSCILSPEHSLKFDRYTIFQFMHSTLQEFFAAKYLHKKIRKLRNKRSSQSQSENRQLQRPLQALDLSSQNQSEENQLEELFQTLKLDESQSDIKEEMERFRNVIKFLILEILANGDITKYRNTLTLLLKKYYTPKGFSPVYHLDLILSSDSNADIISIVSDCLSNWDRYDLEFNKHIKPMAEVIRTLPTAVKITFESCDAVNSHQLTNLMRVMGDDSEIELDLHHSYVNYQPLEGGFYSQLNKIKCKLIYFKACISSEEHLSIVVRAFRSYGLNSLGISTQSVSNMSFAVLEEFRGILGLRINYTDTSSSTGSNPVREKTHMVLDHIPADGKDTLYQTIKYISPKSEPFGSIDLDHCHLTDTDAMELLKQLHRDKIRTGWLGERTEVIKIKLVSVRLANECETVEWI